MAAVIAIEGVTKTFGAGRRKVEALRGIGFSVNRGETFGVLGPNGSGKTTTLRLLMGFLRPDTGICKVFGRPAVERADLHRIGYLPETLAFFERSSGEDNLRCLARLAGLRGSALESAIDRAVDVTGMSAYRSRAVKTYSKGMRQRLGWAQALVHDPDLLILDEPATGLDPLGKEAFYNLMKDLRSVGKTVVLCTHELEEAELLCDQVVLFHEGQVLASGAPGTLASEEEELILHIGALRPAEARDLCARLSADGIPWQRVSGSALRKQFHALLGSKGKVSE